jgi:hypothetical protein
MIPVKQTRLYRGKLPHERGNCYPAVIASIMEIGCDEVIQFQELYDECWLDPLNQWLEARGWELESADDFKAFHDQLWIHRFLETDGKNPDGLPGEQWRELTCDWLQDEYYFVGAQSPRDPDVYHICIYQNGAMVHDPHPDGTGILTEQTFVRLKRID